MFRAALFRVFSVFKAVEVSALLDDLGRASCFGVSLLLTSSLVGSSRI